jgi:hypothetical protein
LTGSIIAGAFCGELGGLIGVSFWREGVACLRVDRTGGCLWQFKPPQSTIILGSFMKSHFRMSSSELGLPFHGPLIWCLIARGNPAREEWFGHHLQLKRLIESNNSEDARNLKREAWRMRHLFLWPEARIRPVARRILPQLSIEIESNISKPEQGRFLLRRQAEYSFNAPIFTGVRDGQDSHIAPPNRCAEILQSTIYSDNSIPGKCQP